MVDCEKIVNYLLMDGFLKVIIESNKDVVNIGRNIISIFREEFGYSSVIDFGNHSDEDSVYDFDVKVKSYDDFLKVIDVAKELSTEKTKIHIDFIVGERFVLSVIHKFNVSIEDIERCVYGKIIFSKVIYIFSIL